MTEAVYYKVTSLEGGAGYTGKRTSNYHCWCVILDAEKNVIQHPLSDAFYGKWRKCQTVINRWHKQCEKGKLIQTA